MKTAILTRLRQPSTWAGISALGLILGLPPGTIEAAGKIVAGLGALAAIYLPEQAAQ